MAISQELRQDAHFYHKLRFPGMQPTYITWARILFCSRGLFVIAVQRIANQYSNMRLSEQKGVLRELSVRIILKLGIYLTSVLTKCEFISITAIEAGVYLSNRGHIVLGSRAIGSGTIIHDRVTIGKNNIGERGRPEIGRNVWIGPHSVIYGNIVIADGVTIMPGTVVTRSVSPGVLVQGNPMRVVKRAFDNACLRSSLSTDVAPLLGVNSQD